MLAWAGEVAVGVLGGEEGGDGVVPAGSQGCPAWAARALEYRATVEAVGRAYAIDKGCARVREIEEKTVTPAMLRIEAEDPDRVLVGLENRLKTSASDAP
jgi:hypothetical protein